ncbi:MAG TPA: 30S ribosomal protein S20 [Chthoniobacterales bacterium]|jgi:small subunit ribosomal protein S20|nr:30S ribosomal protein S20 [Chthoniobacterales bacterium]
MANTQSAAKRSRQSLARAMQNRSSQTRLRTLQKRVRANTQLDIEQIRSLISALDKAAKRGIIHRNAANRRKARLNALLAGKR